MPVASNQQIQLIGGDSMSDYLTPSGRRKPAANNAETNETLPLFDFGQTAKATKSAAYQAAKPKLPSRREQALAVLRECGATGCTREELARRMSIPLQSVCRVARDILCDGRATEPGQTRQTATGCQAAVIVAVDRD
jgi:hypothetical protein